MADDVDFDDRPITDTGEDDPRIVDDDELRDDRERADDRRREREGVRG